MHRSRIRLLAAVVAGFVVLVAIGTHFLLPPYLENRVEERLEEHGGRAEVELSAVPAIRLLDRARRPARDHRQRARGRLRRPRRGRVRPAQQVRRGRDRPDRRRGRPVRGRALPARGPGRRPLPDRDGGDRQRPGPRPHRRRAVRPARRADRLDRRRQRAALGAAPVPIDLDGELEAKDGEVADGVRRRAGGGPPGGTGRLGSSQMRSCPTCDDASSRPPPSSLPYVAAAPGRGRARAAALRHERRRRHAQRPAAGLARALERPRARRLPGHRRAARAHERPARRSTAT